VAASGSELVSAEPATARRQLLRNALTAVRAGVPSAAPWHQPLCAPPLWPGSLPAAPGGRAAARRRRPRRGGGHGRGLFAHVLLSLPGAFWASRSSGCPQKP